MVNAKSMLGGDPNKKTKEEKDPVPGPGTYNLPNLNEVPGFRIVAPNGQSKKEIDKTKSSVGP